MRVVVGFCAFSGAALDCALGSLPLSEQALSCQIILRPAAGGLFLGDRNFGIFLIAQAAQTQGHHVLLRLTDRCAAKLLGRSRRLATLIAYNLIRAAMLGAALHTQRDPLSLSFSACRRRLEYWLRDFGSTKRRADATWQQLLAELGQCRLPKRRTARPTEPRARRHLPQTFPPLRGSRAAAREMLKKTSPKS